MLENLRHFGPQIRGRHVLIFVDNLATKAIAIKGAAREKDLTVLAENIWKTITHFDITQWFAWLPSKSNPADGPSRWDIATSAEKEAILRDVKRWNLEYVHRELENYS